MAVMGGGGDCVRSSGWLLCLRKQSKGIKTLLIGVCNSFGCNSEAAAAADDDTRKGALLLAIPLRARAFAFVFFFFFFFYFFLA